MTETLARPVKSGKRHSQGGVPDLGGSLGEAVRFAAFIEGIPMATLYERALLREVARTTYTDKQLRSYTDERYKAIKQLLDARYDDA